MYLWWEPSCGDLNWSRHGNRTSDHVYKRTWSKKWERTVKIKCRPAWQRFVKEDSMEGIRSGRHRRQAPTSMQNDAATLAWVGNLFVNISQVKCYHRISQASREKKSRWKKPNRIVEASPQREHGNGWVWPIEDLDSTIMFFIYLLCRLGDRPEGVPDGALLHREERE